MAEGKVPLVAGPWTDLRKAPTFDAERIPLAKTWGPTLAPGTPFRVEKVYGRWLFGTPDPPKRMKPVDYAKPGWVFSRMLVLPGDKDTLTPEQSRKSFAVLYHSREARRKLKLSNDSVLADLDFLESLAVSRKTLDAFSKGDETGLTWRPEISLLPRAWAAEETSPSMGLTGSDLSFLDQEFGVVVEKRKKQEAVRQAQILRPPKPPALDASARLGVLGRYMLQKYFELPPLTHEEVDGYVYLRATGLRALEGCPKPVRDFWKSRRWQAFRVFRLKSRPEVRHPWLDVALPGGYFTFSARAIDLASNESELAYLVVRSLVREARVKRPSVTFPGKDWTAALPNQSELLWDQTLRAQSTKDSENLDVADDIAIDRQAMECLGRAGYRPHAALSYLRKLGAAREEPWTRWVFSHAIGFDYRLERVNDELEEGLAKQDIPHGKVSNTKRFLSATRRWNLMP